MSRLVAVALFVTLTFVLRAQPPLTASDSAISVRRFVAPPYPLSAWLAKLQGIVVSDVRIGTDGSVQSVDSSSPYPLLQQPVESAIRQWLFQPISEIRTLRVSTQFRLDGDCPQDGTKQSDTNFYIYSTVSADLPSRVEIRACLPVFVTNTSEVH